jgi:hypothetical protein
MKRLLALCAALAAYAGTNVPEPLLMGYLAHPVKALIRSVTLDGGPASAAGSCDNLAKRCPTNLRLASL